MPRYVLPQKLGSPTTTQRKAYWRVWPYLEDFLFLEVCLVGVVAFKLFSFSFLAFLQIACVSFNQSERHFLREALLQFFFRSFASCTSPSALQTRHPPLLKLQVKCPHALRFILWSLKQSSSSSSSSSPQKTNPQHSFGLKSPWFSQNSSLHLPHFWSGSLSEHVSHQSPSVSLAQQPKAISSR